ncbi:unnamed protein product [Protopolystoma xenopodis]|uniref:Uncharacterized protein n=1 Tax=Protopolystoma xenopodis TaxID=117903 RepID=A0A448X3J5_9PLAT|nr:unnamed protein product [Protopolystoma xenopodis]
MVTRVKTNQKSSCPDWKLRSRLGVIVMKAIKHFTLQWDNGITYFLNWVILRLKEVEMRYGTKAAAKLALPATLSASKRPLAALNNTQFGAIPNPAHIPSKLRKIDQALCQGIASSTSSLSSLASTRFNNSRKPIDTCNSSLLTSATSLPEKPTSIARRIPILLTQRTPSANPTGKLAFLSPSRHVATSRGVDTAKDYRLRSHNRGIPASKTTSPFSLKRRAHEPSPRPVTRCISQLHWHPRKTIQVTSWRSP